MATALLRIWDHQDYCRGRNCVSTNDWVLLAAVAISAGAGACRRASPGFGAKRNRAPGQDKVQPAYPDLARKMNITGTVKSEVVCPQTAR
jgi:outer membrane biosynthesis protein TonB